MIVKDNHKKVLHNGFKHAYQNTKKLLVVRSRNYIKKILRKCVICRKFNGRYCRYSSSSNLPRLRVNEDNPFGSIGIYYFGPLYYKAHKQPLFFVTTNNKTEMLKCYVILYTCTITRAIILDLVNSLRTFIASRGCPKNVISDNGKVFSADETQAFYSNKGASYIHVQNRPADTVRPVK